MDKLINHKDKQLSNISRDTYHNSDVQMALGLITNRFFILEEEINSKNKKLKENEDFIHTLSEQNRSIRDYNIQISNENTYLKELCTKLKEENISLTKLRSRIMNSIKNEDLFLDNFNNYETILTENDYDASLKRDNTYDDNINHRKMSTTINNKYLSSHGYKNKINTKFNPTHEDSTEQINLPKSKENSIAGNTSENADNLVSKIKDKYNSKSKAYDEYSNSKKTMFKIDGRINELKDKLKINKKENDAVSNKSYTFSSKGYNSKYPEYIDYYTSKNDDELSNSHSINNKSRQYILSLNFFNNCRILLDNKSYHNLVCTLIEKNNKNINQEDVYSRVRGILARQPELLKDFEEIFPTLNDDIYYYLKKT